MSFRTGRRRAFGALMLSLLLCGPAFAAETAKKNGASGPPPPTPPASAGLTPGYAVKPSDVAVPPDVPLGQYVRTIRPFPNWTLICDENRVKKQKVCNISQEILGPAGGVVFSWSLAAMADGRPVMILRIPAGGLFGKVALDLQDGHAPLEVPVYGCDERLCIAYQPVDARLRAAMEAARMVGVAYEVKENGAVRRQSFRAPLAGLKQALSAI